MKATHYDGFIDPEEEITPICGTQGVELDGSDDWDWVSCKRCLKLKDKAIEERKRIESDIIQQMGDFVEFMKSQKINEIEY
jgi:hypothetical protein